MLLLAWAFDCCLIILLLIIWFNLLWVHSFHFVMGNHEIIQFTSVNIEGHWFRGVVFWGRVKFGWLRWSHWIGNATMKIIPTWLLAADWTLCTWNNWRPSCIWKYWSSIYWSGLTLMCGIWWPFDNSKSVLGVFAWWLQKKCLWWFEHVIVGVAEHRYGWGGWLEWENWECTQQKPSFLPTSMHQKKYIMACWGWEVYLFIIFAIEKVWSGRLGHVPVHRTKGRKTDWMDQGSSIFHKSSSGVNILMATGFNPWGKVRSAPCPTL